MLFLSTALIAIATYFAKFSNPACCFVFFTELNSSIKLRYLVRLWIYVISWQKYRHSFCLHVVFVYVSSPQSSKVRDAISVKHLIASILVSTGTKKFCSNTCMIWVSKM